MFKNYIQVRDWLESFIPQVYGKKELGLARIEHLLNKLGNPETKFKSIHVAGTAGKGSTCFYIARLLEGQGLKVGLHISPHLVYIGERMQINGKPISVKRLIGLVNKVKPVVEAISVSQPELLPSYFEILVALSFLYFAGEKVDIAVVEVGLGGRLDATNVLQSRISVITNIGLDHTELLGDTVEKIAKEKAGIIKNKVPVVTGATGKVLKVIEKAARLASAPIIKLDLSQKCESKRAKSKNASLINIYTQGNKNEHKLDLFSSIAKPFDIDRYIPYYVNRDCAFLAISVVSALGMPLKALDLKKAFSTEFPGRFEEIDEKIIVDGAHNPDKVKTLIKWIKSSQFTVHSSQKIVLVVAFKKGKNWQEMINLLLENLPIKKIIATQYFATTDMGKGSAVDPEEIKRYVETSYQKLVKTINNSQRAVFSATSDKSINDLVLVAGSLYLVGEVRTLWKLPQF